MIIKYKKQKINIPIRKVSYFGKVSGLIFKNKETKNLLFEFKKETNMRIHSFFVFFTFLAIWTNKKNEVIEFRFIKPFNPVIKPKKSFQKLIEIPLNNKNKKIISYFVGKRKV